MSEPQRYNQSKHISGILLTKLRQAESNWSHNRCSCQTLFNQRANHFLYNFLVIILASYTYIERTLIYPKSSQTLAKIIFGGRHQTSQISTWCTIHLHATTTPQFRLQWYPSICKSDDDSYQQRTRQKYLSCLLASQQTNIRRCQYNLS